MVNLNCSGNCIKCKKCNRYIAGSNQYSIKNLLHDFPLDFRPDFANTVSYGISFDLGTTTVSGSLWNLETAVFIGAHSLPNYQREYGSDVISRIQFCSQSDSNLSHMQSLLVQCMNDIINELCAKNTVPHTQIQRITLVGNSTMSHLVLGVSPHSLSVSPFKPAFYTAQKRTALELGIHADPQADIYLLPNIDGQVGSDTIGMILATRFSELKGCHIAVDIGTNGEVVVIKDGRMLTCSTAAGPAFEGASIYHGMCAAPGAIESVEYKNYDIKINTIDNQPAIGICGSGLIDTIACLLTCRIVDQTGHMLTAEEAMDAHLPQTLVKRLTTIDGMPAFILSFSNSGTPILLTQKDIREVQLAKGALLAGIQTLMNALHMTEEEIDSLILAGAFGNYINKKSALKIGLIPSIPLEKIKSVGNAAGTGASMALLSEAEYLSASKITKQIEHLDLSSNIDFQKLYLDAMIL